MILDNDTNPEVRRAVLSCIAPCAQTLSKILRRTRDVKEAVRKLAYQVALPDDDHMAKSLWKPYELTASLFQNTFAIGPCWESARKSSVHRTASQTPAGGA